MITLETYYTEEGQQQERVLKEKINLSDEDSRNKLLAVLEKMKPVKITPISIIFHLREGSYPDRKLDHFVTLNIGNEIMAFSLVFGS